jgi:hypothetical protein
MISHKMVTIHREFGHNILSSTPNKEFQQLKFQKLPAAPVIRLRTYTPRPVQSKDNTVELDQLRSCGADGRSHS